MWHSSSRLLCASIFAFVFGASSSRVDVDVESPIVGQDVQSFVRQVSAALTGEDYTHFGRSLDAPELLKDAVTRLRRAVLRDTLTRLGTQEARVHYHQLAAENLRKWQGASESKGAGEILIGWGDWGQITADLTLKYGATFAVLNVANAQYPGGGYVEGLGRQEENMFRRTDCHFSIDETEFDADLELYLPEITDLINGEYGEKYLDVKRPRVCVRGPEQRSDEQLGYRWLEDGEVFPFFEMRAAPKDLRDGIPFSRDLFLRTVEMQLSTLKKKGVRHVVLGPFGTQVGHPPREVADCYRAKIAEHRAGFDVIAFAVGQRTFPAFTEIFAQLPNVYVTGGNQTGTGLISNVGSSDEPAAAELTWENPNSTDGQQPVEEELASTFAPEVKVNRSEQAVASPASPPQQTRSNQSVSNSGDLGRRANASARKPVDLTWTRLSAAATPTGRKNESASTNNLAQGLGGAGSTATPAAKDKSKAKVTAKTTDKPSVEPASSPQSKTPKEKAKPNGKAVGSA